MPTSPLPPCRYEGCANRCERGERYCEEHRLLMEHHYERFTRGYKTSQRYGSRWARIRNRYIHAHPLCEECAKAGRYVDATVVHHRLPLADGGTHDETNLESLCTSCHERIHRERGDRDPSHDR